MESITALNDGMTKYFSVVTGMDFDSWIEWLRCKAYYFGEEYSVENKIAGREDIGEKMETALLESGLVQPSFIPLGAESSLVSPSGARHEKDIIVKQLKMFENNV